jgi:hypothetical protein
LYGSLNGPRHAGPSGHVIYWYTSQAQHRRVCSRPRRTQDQGKTVGHPQQCCQHRGKGLRAVSSLSLHSPRDPDFLAYPKETADRSSPPGNQPSTCPSPKYGLLACQLPCPSQKSSCLCIVLVTSESLRGLLSAASIIPPLSIHLLCLSLGVHPHDPYNS